VVCDQIVSRENKTTIFELHIVINVLISKSMLTLQKNISKPTKQKQLLQPVTKCHKTHHKIEYALHIWNNDKLIKRQKDTKCKTKTLYINNVQLWNQNLRFFLLSVCWN